MRPTLDTFLIKIPDDKRDCLTIQPSMTLNLHNYMHNRWVIYIWGHLSVVFTTEILLMILTSHDIFFISLLSAAMCFSKIELSLSCIWLLLEDEVYLSAYASLF
jgi:hypothetical protein